MCAERLSGLGRGDGTAGVVRAWSPGAGPAGGVVMAGVLAHHLQMVGEHTGEHQQRCQWQGRCDFPPIWAVPRGRGAPIRPRYRYCRAVRQVAGALYLGRPPG